MIHLPHILGTLHVIADNWWTFLVRGIIAVLFGIVAVMMPGITLLWLVVGFAVFSIVEGISMIVFGIRGRAHGAPFLAELLLGLIGIAAGVIALAMPGKTMLILLVTIAIWCIIRGVLDITAGIRLRKVIDHEWALIATGVISIFFGIMLLRRPETGLLVIAWTIAMFAVLQGVVLIALSIRLRRIDKRFEAHAAGAPNPV